MTNFKKFLFDEAIERDKEFAQSYHSRLNFNKATKIKLDEVISIIKKCGLEDEYLVYKAKQSDHRQVKEVMKNEDNDGEKIIEIVGKNPYDDYDSYAISYYEGKLKDIPEHLQNQEVLGIRWSMGFTQKYQIIIPYLDFNKEIAR